MKKLAALLVVASCSSMANEANTDDLNSYRAFNTPYNYNYGTVSFGSASIDGIEENATTISGGGESMLTENVILGIGYSGAFLDLGSVTSNSNVFGLSLKYRTPINESFDFVVGAGVGYSWLEATACYLTCTEFTDSDVALSGDLQVRFAATDKLEGLLGLNVASVYDSTETAFISELNYYFNESFGLGVGASLADESTSVNGNLRFRF
jgi:hypothetical protein